MERGHFKNKRRYDTPGQTQWCSLRGPRLIPPKSDLNLLQLFSTYFSPREGKKKQEQIQIKWNKLKRIHENGKKRMEIERLSTLLAGLSAWPSCTPYMHTPFPCAGWLSCLAMPEYPGRLGAAGNCIAVPPPYARQRAAPRRSLHRRKERRSEVARRDLSSSRIS